MSEFNFRVTEGKVYDLSKYSLLVVAYLENTGEISNPYGKGKIEGTDGVIYHIDLNHKSFIKFKTKALLEHNDGSNWKDLAKHLKKEENQFRVLSTKPPSEPGERGKYETLGWQQIQKIAFSSPGVKLQTKEQEKITLLIFEAVLGKSTPDYGSFGKMFEPREKNPTGKPYSKVKKLFPKLRTEKGSTIKSWWQHFDLQYRTVATTDKFPNSKYDVYLYDGKNSFMDYVSELVTKDIKFVSKKDNWNPADVWLLKTGAKDRFADKVKGIKEKIEKEEYKDNRLGPIRDINKTLMEEYNAKEIVGISLKKSDGIELKYTEFNLNANEKISDLPNVKFDTIILDCSYDAENYKFKKKTGTVLVNDGTPAYKMTYKSNTGEGKLGNITYEFLPASGATAFLGKVPKDSLKSWLTTQIQVKSKLKSDIGPAAPIRMPTYSVYPEDIGPISKPKAKEFLKGWQLKIKKIKTQFPTDSKKIKGLDSFVENLANSYTQKGLYNGNATMMQLVEFTWILALLKEQNQLETFLTRAYYFAQKKGIKYNFGPFGKLY